MANMLGRVVSCARDAPPVRDSDRPPGCEGATVHGARHLAWPSEVLAPLNRR